MKSLITLHLLFFISISSIAQIGVWTPTQLISPEGEDCFNGKIFELKPTPSHNVDFYLIYNKTINDSTIGIYARSVNTIDEEVEIYKEEGRICSFNSFMGSSTNAYIFYTQNTPGGQRDIYYRRIHNGTFSNPVPFATTSGDEHNFNCTIGANRAVWQCNDTIKTKSLQNDNNSDNLIIDEVVIIEGGGCSSPIINRYNTTIRYIKDIGGAQQVRETTVSDNNPDFDIVTRFQGQQIKNLKAIPSIFEYYKTCSWERLDSQHKIFICDWEDWQGLNALDSLPWTFQNQFNPSFFHYDIMCDGFPNMGCMALELNNNLSQNVYATNYWLTSNISDLVKISQSSNPAQNPSLHQGLVTLGGGYFEIILVYEEVINGKRHLMSCRRNESYGGVEEGAQKYSNITISPNPITTIFTATIKNPELKEIQFTLYSLNGMKTKTLSRDVNAGSVNEIQFSVEDFGGNVVPGPYVLECRDGESKEVIKIMIM